MHLNLLKLKDSSCASGKGSGGGQYGKKESTDIQEKISKFHIDVNLSLVFPSGNISYSNFM